MEKILFKTEKGKGSVTYKMFLQKKVNKLRIGEITVGTDEERDDFLFVSSSVIELKYRGKGYGKLLYSHAIEELGMLKTSYWEASEQAQYCWISLCKIFKYRKDFFNGVLTLYNNPK